MHLSAEEVAGDQYQLFESWYNKLDPKNVGSVQAGSAAQFLKKSGLNDGVLSRIWDLSDPGGKGYLDKAGLFVALKLVALVQNGKEPNLANVKTVTSPPNMGEAPPHPPPPMSKSPGPPLVPAPPAPTVVNSTGVWNITPSDRARYDQIFNSLGPEANKIHGNKVRGVMLNSKLPMDTLGKIWDLADMDKDGSLDRVEFSIAMHLIYKVLENNQLPVALPQEMLSSARRAGVAGQGPVPTPLAPPSQALVSDNNKLQSSGPPPAPWVVTAGDKARYDVMFHNADLDKDGFVSGQEIKGVFLQSGLPQMVLAHIWNICDMKQTGKLTSEQFALAMWLIQQKIAGGVDPPSTLTPEMIPPTMRPKPATEPVAPKPTYSNPELQAIADEIEELSKDKLKLESEIQQKEASIRIKNNEIKNLQTELDTLSATLKQLENQKGAAQKRLDDLGQQVEALRTQVQEQETSLQAQEDEVMSKQKELNDLRSQEMELEASVLSMKNKIELLTVKQQETLLFISQVKNKIEELQDQERHMTEVMTAYDAAITAEDATTLSESALMEVEPHFNDPRYMNVGGPSESPVKDALSPVMSPVSSQNLPNANGTLSDTANENTPKVKDTSFVGGHDPFAQVFGGSQPNADPFAVWDSTKSNPAPVVQPNTDPFGGDAFVAKTAPPVPPPAVTSSAAKKSKQPPPRPAPPKTRPVKPPPPQYTPQTNSNNNPATNDPFGGSGWSDSSKSNNKNDGFADFSKFPEFEAKYSSASSSSPLKFPRAGDFFDGKRDPFEDSLRVARNPSRPHQTSNSNGTWGLIDSPFGSSGFGSQNGGGETHHHPDGSTDPFFGGDYDPFKDSQGIKEADEFSWDDEADDALFSDGFSAADSHHSGNLGEEGGRRGRGAKDPFSFDDFSPEPKIKNSRNVLAKNNNNNNKRSKSALGDPFIPPSRGAPMRPKTSLGNPGNLDLDFDPLSTSKTTFPTWKSNEDLLNENLNVSSPAPPAGRLKNNDNDAWGVHPSPWGGGGRGGDDNFTNNNSSSDINFNSTFGDAFGGDSWGARPTGGEGKLEDENPQERADLELALALSRSLMPKTTQSPHRMTARSPSTGL